ncbi:carboxysome shell carbonic anhydrase domain-containg protein [Billgrantia saliphila]|uniref:carboxysome shell carbonic anhydrase domain-containg protein n=1 Tax=Billgrantia saliphila TaxID=1848458 RepID=UPI000CE3E994|nr:carboxysome shell carbonic anhydrase domain-containg protein [Halomonas saliphila]
MPLHDRPIDERIEALLALSREHADTFCSPSAWLARERYLATHPTRILAMKCMDGRIHLPHATRTPLGIITPFRNLGGIFHLGWPYLGEMLTDAVDEAIRAGNGVLLIISYHFSRGERSRGCAGFGCDTSAALAHAQEIRRQAERIFGREQRHVYPLVCGFETDRDALIVHGETDATLDMSELTPDRADELDRRIATLCPDMPADIRRDLLPLLEGNLHHVEALRGTARALDIEHREWVICIGRGFDFLHLPNTALIVGPYSPDLSEPIGTAAAIIEANMHAGRIPDDGFLLLASTPYSTVGVDRARAEMKSRFLSDFAARVIGRDCPDLAKQMHSRKAVVHWPSRRLELLGATDRGES